MLWKQAGQGEEGQVAMLHWKVKLSFSERKQNWRGTQVIGQDIWENNIWARRAIRTSRRLTEATGWTQRPMWLVLSGWRGAGVKREIAVEGRDPLGMLVVTFYEMENSWRVWAGEWHELTSVINTLADVLRIDHEEESWKLWDLLGG